MRTAVQTTPERLHGPAPLEAYAWLGGSQSRAATDSLGCYSSGSRQCGGFESSTFRAPPRTPDSFRSPLSRGLRPQVRIHDAPPQVADPGSPEVPQAGAQPVVSRLAGQPLSQAEKSGAARKTAAKSASARCRKVGIGQADSALAGAGPSADAPMSDISRNRSRPSSLRRRSECSALIARAVSDGPYSRGCPAPARWRVCRLTPRTSLQPQPDQFGSQTASIANVDMLTDAGANAKPSLARQCLERIGK